MKIGGNEMRPGNVILHEQRLWIVVKTQHTQPGKGGAYVQTELKELKGGCKKNERFRSSESIERVFLEEKEMHYLYEQQGQYTFMDPNTYEQVTLPNDMLSVSAAFLQEGMSVVMGCSEGVPVFVHLPAHVTLAIEETEPALKGQTAAGSFKPARLSNGMKIMVPGYIDVGDRVVVNTEDGRYAERAKG